VFDSAQNPPACAAGELTQYGSISSNPRPPPKPKTKRIDRFDAFFYFFSKKWNTQNWQLCSYLYDLQTHLQKNKQEKNRTL